MTRGFHNRCNVNDLEAYPIFRCHQPRIFQSPIIPRLLLRQTYPQNPSAAESTRTKRRSHTGIQTARHTYDEAACSCFRQVSCKKSFKSAYCLFWRPNGEGIVAEPGGHSVPDFQANVISREA